MGFTLRLATFFAKVFVVNFRGFILFICISASVFAGCVSNQKGPVYRAGDENPPPFLVPPMAVLLTNLHGFGAHVTWAPVGDVLDAHTNAGELLGRDAHLLFQPSLSLKGKRLLREGGLYYIWDADTQSGCVLSEALQSYGPIHAAEKFSGSLELHRSGIQETINHQPCHRYDALVRETNGAATRFLMWEDDVNHFPTRIETTGARRMQLDFSEVKLQSPPLEIFSAPGTFTAYASGLTLVNELIVRDSRLTKKNEFETSDEPADILSSQHGPTTPTLR